MPQKLLSYLSAGVGLVLLLFAAGVAAHHGPIGPALYEADELFVVEGELSEIFWRSPHVRFAVTEITEDGDEIVWQVEAGPGPNEMRRNGLTENMFPLGEQVRVAGFVSRWNDSLIGIRHMLLPDGEEYTETDSLLWSNVRLGGDTRSAAGVPRGGGVPRRGGGPAISPEAVAAARAAADGLFRYWVPAMNPGEWRQANDFNHLLTPLAIETRENWDPTTHPVLRCIPRGFPEGMVITTFEFIDEGDTILMPTFGWTRTIHMGSDDIPPDTERSNVGYSTGHWEDETLVVRTTHLNWPYFYSDGTPQSEQVEFVERFTLSEDETQLDYVTTATDPLYFAEPITLVHRFEWRPGGRVSPDGFQCELWDAGGRSD